MLKTILFVSFKGGANRSTTTDTNLAGGIPCGVSSGEEDFNSSSMTTD